MMSSNTTPAIEDVNGREQGNTQTQGESGTGSKDATKRQRRRNKHTVTGQHIFISDSDKRSKQRPKQRSYRDNLANRDKRTDQWHLRMRYNAKSFKKSSDRDRLKSEPTYEDLMNVVNNANCLVAAPEGQEEADKKLAKLKAFQGKQAVQGDRG